MTYLNSVACQFPSSMLCFVCACFLPVATNQAVTLPTLFLQGKSIENDYRTWTDRSGNSIEAKFVEMKSNTVKLEKKDGETITIGIQKLSIKDMQLAARLSAQQAFGDRGFNGFGSDRDIRLPRNAPRTELKEAGQVQNQTWLSSILIAPVSSMLTCRGGT
jgi:hypothetical protein